MTLATDDRQPDLLSWTPPQSPPAVTPRSHFDQTAEGDLHPPRAVPPIPPLCVSAGVGEGAQRGSAVGSCRGRTADPAAHSPMGESESEGAHTRVNSAAATGPKLRGYQEAGIAAVEERFAAGDRATLLVLPTGTGKTVVFAELARREVASGGRALILAHRTELLTQAARKLADVALHASIDQAQRKGSQLADVVVGSVQTLQRKRLERYRPEAFTLVVIDEAHHALAKSYRNVLDYFAAAKVLGVTATPDRGDGGGLGHVFQSVAYRYDMRTAIAEGHLAPLRAKRIVVEDLDISEVSRRHGDFAIDELAAVMNDEKALHGVVGPLMREAGDRKTLVFGVDVAHAHALAELLNRNRPGSAMAIDGSAKTEERTAVLSLFQRGEFQFLCNCALFTEGFDEPSIECVATARMTQSRALHTQMIGRGTRKHPGKTDCLILDFVGNSGRHKLVGPADCLAGRDLTDEERKAVEEKLAEEGAEQLELEQVLANAEAEAKAAKQRVNSEALAKYRATDIDLFLGDVYEGFDPESPAAKRPATPEQLERLDQLGFSKPPPGLSEAEAIAMFRGVRERQRQGLCSVKQARCLERHKIDTKGMSFDRAGQLIGMIKAVGWNKAWFALSGEPEYRAGRR